MDLLKIKMFDPRTIDWSKFVQPPFIKCPNCQKDSFGNFMINGDGYTKRCRECWYDDSFELPKIQKKIIYLDQFAISNLMKVRSGKSEDSFWKTLDKKLTRLAILQLIICPTSEMHLEESMLGGDEFYKKDMETANYFASGISFIPFLTIRRFQIGAHISNWIQNKNNRETIIELRHVINGDFNAWSNYFFITVPINPWEEWIRRVQTSKDNTYVNLGPVFDRWRSEKNRSFDEWYEEEVKGFGDAAMAGFRRHVANQQLIENGGKEPTIDDILGGDLESMRMVMDALMIEGIKGQNQAEKAFEYINSFELLKEVPFIRIGALMTAHVAHKAAHGGQTRQPNKGWSSDTDAISHLLPYCEAMLIDEACRECLTSGQVKSHLGFNTRLFSVKGEKNRQDLLDFLDDLESSADAEHLRMARELYGLKD